MCEFDKLDKTFASDLYLIYKCSPSARVCISDKDQLLMFYLSLKLHVYLSGCRSVPSKNDARATSERLPIINNPKRKVKRVKEI